MSVEENKALVRRLYELVNRKEIATAFELFDPGYCEHSTSQTMFLEEVKNLDRMFVVAFPDIISTLEYMVAEGDKVAIRVTWRGSHKGQFMGIPPTGNRIEMTNTAIYRIAEGRLAENWYTGDDLRLMRQLGVIPKK